MIDLAHEATSLTSKTLLTDRSLWGAQENERQQITSAHLATLSSNEICLEKINTYDF